MSRTAAEINADMERALADLQPKPADLPPGIEPGTEAHQAFQRWADQYQNHQQEQYEAHHSPFDH